MQLRRDAVKKAAFVLIPEAVGSRYGRTEDREEKLYPETWLVKEVIGRGNGG